MTTTKKEIGQWFEEGLKEKADYMIVVCDTFSYEDYPVYVGAPNSIHDAIAYYRRSPMQQIMEIYDLRKDKMEQLNTPRVFNYPKETHAGSRKENSQENNKTNS